MSEALAHRGPDDRGIYLNPDRRGGLAHTRLSVIDLSESGRQPMDTEDGSVWIVYNGEVYNYREIRRELEAKGHRFRSATDTEVLLKAYVEWGLDSLPKLNGMFAFGLWDRRRKQLLLVRDRVGVKPLYYYWDGETFLFASELKAMLACPGFSRGINPDAVREYLKWGYVPTPLAIFENTFKLEPGHYVILDEDGGILKHAYWELPKPVVPRRDDCDERRVLQELRDVLASAFQYRLVADVPVGVFLSGGVDSSLVTAIIRKELGQPVMTFTIGFSEQAYDESVWARRVASRLGTEHHELLCTAEDMRQMVTRLPEVFDEPFADSSVIPACLVARFASNTVKVALSADGGDELFGGYRHHLRLMRLQALQRLPGLVRTLRAISRAGGACSLISRLISSVVANRAGAWALQDRVRKLRHILGESTVTGMQLAYLRYWYDDELADLLSKGPSSEFVRGGVEDEDPVNAMLRLDFELGLPDDMLTKMDRACMAVGLENREPMLDYRIVERAFLLPGECKLKNGIGKYLLKKLLERYLPPEWIYRPKQGFIIPLQEWLRSDLSSLCQDYLGEESLRRSGIFNEKAVRRYLNAFLIHGGIYAHKIWALLTFQAWWRRWMES